MKIKMRKATLGICAVALLSLGSPHVHGQEGEIEGDKCSICECDDNLFSPVYHHDVCDPPEIATLHCSVIQPGHHCDNY